MEKLDTGFLMSIAGFDKEYRYPNVWTHDDLNKSGLMERKEITVEELLTACHIHNQAKINFITDCILPNIDESNALEYISLADQQNIKGLDPDSNVVRSEISRLIFDKAKEISGKEVRAIDLVDISDK